jgi:4-azaleucine resistance transporter AzlC
VPERLRQGLRASAPYAVASLLLSFSFGAVAVAAGLSPLAAIVMSAIVYAGSAQFASVGILAAGGGVGAAVAAAALMNSRFLPMGVALGPSLPGGRLRRALQGQTVVDSSWALALRPDGSFDRLFLFGHSAGQYLCWVTGTALGVLGGGVDAKALGLDAVFPAFFLSLLVGELRKGTRTSFAVTLAGAALAIALVPVTPVGVPVLVASCAALVGLRRTSS